ncbi:MAG: hypothetical protein OEM82_03735 [Acidobacteriota bacterium]|nr:hypothetical protein [Acidobacteriota bacterium]MDH3530900.1 hypothetical protein [Acidobacteriota bacterium]
MHIGFKTSFIVAVIGLIFLNGCSSCGGPPTENSNAAGANINVITPQRATNINVSANANAKPQPYPGIKEGDNPTLDNSKVQVIDTTKARVDPPARKGPDNSELTTIMNSKGEVIESRRFLNHEQLEKMERITRSPRDVTIKVFLRNGKVIEIANDKIASFKNVKPDQVLIAAGVKPIPKSTSKGTKEEELKKRSGIKSPLSDNE